METIGSAIVLLFIFLILIIALPIILLIGLFLYIRSKNKNIKNLSDTIIAGINLFLNYRLDRSSKKGSNTREKKVESKSDVEDAEYRVA